MTDWFPPLVGVHIAGWFLTAGLGVLMIGNSHTVVTAYGGFLVGFCLLWAWLRYRYQSIEFRTTVEEVSE